MSYENSGSGAKISNEEEERESGLTKRENRSKTRTFRNSSPHDFFATLYYLNPHLGADTVSNSVPHYPLALLHSNWQAGTLLDQVYKAIITYSIKI